VPNRNTYVSGMKLITFDLSPTLPKKKAENGMKEECSIFSYHAFFALKVSPIFSAISLSLTLRAHTASHCGQNKNRVKEFCEKCIFATSQQKISKGPFTSAKDDETNEPEREREGKGKRKVF
jgi:hypothetical protein